MELLPCPFCGSADVEMVTRYELFVVECQDCGAVGQDRANEHYAAAAWNRRAANAPADPALLALAKLGAEVLHYSSVADERRERSGIYEADGMTYAPGVLALADRLLAPDGAASEGVTDGD